MSFSESFVHRILLRVGKLERKDIENRRYRLSNFDRFDWILLSLGDGMIDATIERKKEKIIRASGLREESVRELNKFIVDDGMEVYYHSSSRCS